MLENNTDNLLILTAPKVASIRHSYGLSQRYFAELLGISVKTLQNWEISRTKPCGPACALLDIAEKNPNAFLQKRKKIKCSKEIAEKLLKNLHSN